MTFYGSSSILNVTSTRYGKTWLVTSFSLHATNAISAFEIQIMVNVATLQQTGTQHCFFEMFTTVVIFISYISICRTQES